MHPKLRLSSVIASFIVSAGCAVFVFFVLLDLALWDNISTRGAFMVVSVSWLSIFPLWAFVFLLLMSLLDAIDAGPADQVRSAPPPHR